MRKLITFFAAAAIAASAWAAEAPQVTLSTNTPAVNEPFYLQVTTSGGGAPDIRTFPKLEGAAWLSDLTSQSTRIINGRRSDTRSFAIMPQRKGKLVIPELTISHDGKDFTLNKIELDVVEGTVAAGNGGDQAGAGAISYSDAIFGRVKIASDRRTFYAGEAIPLEYILYIMNGVNVRQFTYPEPDLEKVAFADYRKSNPENPRFMRYIRGKTEAIDKRSYDTLIFRTVCRAVAPGKLIPGGRGEAAIIVRDRNRSDDDFFAGFFGNTRTVPLAINYTPGPELTVKALPKAPAGASFTGLVGDYSIIFKLDKNVEKTGGLINLTCTVSGPSDAVETVRAPELRLPGFRVYPPEVKPGADGGVTINYAMIPLQAGTLPLELNMAVFDPVDGKYREFKFSEKLTVEAADVTAVPVVPPENNPPRSAEDETTAPSADFRQLKNDFDATVKLPLLSNTAPFVLLLFIAGPLLLAAVEIGVRRSERLSADPVMRRRIAAKKRRGELMKKLRSASDAETLIELGNNEICETVADLRVLPCGSSATELAGEISDAEDAALLRELGEARFNRSASGFDAETLRKRLMKLLRHAGVLLLGFLAFSARATDAGNTAFEKGDNLAAIAAYSRELKPDAPSAALLYNLGCAYAAAGDMPRALVALTESNLLSPGDEQIINELNRVRVRLLLNPTGEVKSPSDLAAYLRDRLRPDQWLLAIGILYFIAFLALALRRTIGKTAATSVFAVAVLLLFAAAGALFTQARGAYSPDNAVIVAAKAELRTLPTRHSGEVEATLSGGTEVRISESRENFSLVSGGGKRGWVENSALCRILPRGLI